MSGDHPRPPVEKVLVYHYPYENDDSQVRKVLSHFGSFEDISYQSWVSLKGVHTGTRIVRMVHTSHTPRSLMIDGFRCKIWYRGQPVTCDVSKEDGHVAAKCPKKDTCFNWHQPGHVSRKCPDRSYGRGALGPVIQSCLRGFRGRWGCKWWVPGRSTTQGMGIFTSHNFGDD